MKSSFPSKFKIFKSLLQKGWVVLVGGFGGWFSRTSKALIVIFFAYFTYLLTAKSKNGKDDLNFKCKAFDKLFAVCSLLINLNRKILYIVVNLIFSEMFDKLQVKGLLNNFGFLRVNQLPIVSPK